MYARLIVAGIIVALAGGLWWSIDTAATKAAELEQAEQAITHLSDTIREERARNDETDRMLAATARDRAWLEQEADALALQLSDARSDNDCLNTRIPESAVIRLFRYRDRAAGPAGTSPENLDGSATAAQYRPTFGQYIAKAEQFFQHCNSDRVSVGEWSRESNHAE
jgi:hypothetical protein